MSRLCASLLILVSVIVFQSRQSSTYNLPTDPNDEYYQSFQKVSSLDVTAGELFYNFLFSHSDVNFFREFCRTGQFSLIIKDIVIVMDGSGSVPRCEFEKGKKALQHMIGFANTTEADVKHAAVTFASSVTVNFKFLPYSSAANGIQQIPYPGGTTNTQAGLTEAKKLFDDPSSGRRIGGSKIVFLVTDGHSSVQQHLTIPTANALKTSGVEIFVVAVGTYISGIDELVKVASYPPEKHMFRVKNLQQFWNVIKLVMGYLDPGKQNILQGQHDPPC